MSEIKEKIILNEKDLEEAAGGTGIYADGRIFTIEHTVVPGNTLSGLANRYNTTVQSIMALNAFIKDKNLIRVGWVLTIQVNDRKRK